MKRVHGWAPAALVAALVAVGAFLPGSAVSFHLFRGADKVVHLVEFALLRAVTYRAVWYTLAAWPAVKAGARQILKPHREESGFDQSLMPRLFLSGSVQG